jgi:hypothetical protein
MKDHEIAKVVNELRDIATQYHDTQQLRERIAGIVVPLLAQSDHSGDGGDAWAISDAMRMDEDGRLPQDCDSVKAMVHRFLTWPLPSSVCADKCATDNSYQYPRSGTNLLNAIEAEAMIRHVIGITLPEVGVDERAMENALRYIDGQLTEYLELMPADETSIKLRDCARAALASNKAAAVAVGDLVAVPRELLGAACSAIDKKRDAPNVLAKLREITFAPKAAAVAARPTDDALWDQTLTERDNYHEWADKLANAIAEHFGIEIGEHSNLNNPWAVALEALENMAAQKAHAWRTTEPAVCVPMTEDSGVAALWREAGFDVIELFEHPAPIASSLSDRDIQEAALEWQCDPAFDHFVFHEDELVEYVRGILARVHSAASRAEVLEQAASLIEPKNEPSDWTEYAKIKAECAAAIRAIKEKL